jgi:hypothetical protein
MEVHKLYNLRSKKTNNNPTKKATEMKKTIEAKKTSDTSLKKSLRIIIMNFLRKEILKFCKDQIKLRSHLLVSQILLPK